MKRIRNTFKELLAKKERRENRRISQRQVAIETGLSKSSIDSWANNSVTRFDEKAMLVFIEYFGVEISDLFVEEDILAEYETALAG